MIKKNGRIDELQILRAIAFLEIFLGHCGVGFFTGAFGVSIFIVLSGFCMAVNYLPKADSISLSPVVNVKSAVGKIKKLYGLHLVMLGVAFLLAKMPSSAEAMKRLVLNVLLVQSLSPYSADFFSYNGVAWYLSAYLFICMMAPYVIKLVAKCKDKKCIYVLAAAIYGVMVAAGYLAIRRPLAMGDNFAFWFTYIFPGYRILEFALGGILGWIYLNGKECEKTSKVWMTVAELLAVCAFLAVIKVFHKMEGVYDGLCYTALFTPVSIYLVDVFAKSRGWCMKVLNNPVTIWIGNISSYTFLIHQMVIRMLQQKLPQSLEGNARVAVIICISFILSAIGAEVVKVVQKYIAEQEKTREFKLTIKS